MSAEQDRTSRSRIGAKEAFGLILVAIVAVFAIANSKKTKIDFVFTHVNLPLVAVIVGSALLGFIVGWVVGVHDNE
jgi:uncharacterized integral membrane protein